MPLPTVLMTDVVRSSQQGDSHGGAYLVDLETQSFEQVLDWNTVDIDWGGRGGERGLRGICFVGDDIYIAASNELFVFDQQFNVLRSFTCEYLRHCHEIVFDGDQYIYLSSTGTDSILRFNIKLNQFDLGWWMRPVTQQHDGKEVTVLFASEFDPELPDGAHHKDTLHINNVCMLGKIPVFSGLWMSLLVAIEDGVAKPFAVVPEMTHNCQPLGQGVVMNSTGEDTVRMADRFGKHLKLFSYPKYEKSDIANSNIARDDLRQGFGRGLCVDLENRLVIAGSSPGTVSVFDVQSEELISKVQVSNDLRNAPHGLEICPY